MTLRQVTWNVAEGLVQEWWIKKQQVCEIGWFYFSAQLTTDKFIPFIFLPHAQWLGVKRRTEKILFPGWTVWVCLSSLESPKLCCDPENSGTTLLNLGCHDRHLHHPVTAPKHLNFCSAFGIHPRQVHTPNLNISLNTDFHAYFPLKIAFLIYLNSQTLQCTSSEVQYAMDSQVPIPILVREVQIRSFPIGIYKDEFLHHLKSLCFILCTQGSMNKYLIFPCCISEQHSSAKHVRSEEIEKYMLM